MRDMCKKAVTRLFQGIVIVKVGFTRSQAIIRDPFPWLRNNLIPKLKDAPKPEVFKQTFSLLMHTNALLFAAEWTVSVVQASYKIIRSRGTNAKAKSMQIVRSLVAQWVRCKILYLITSVGGALAVSLYPAASRMMLQGGILLSDLVIGIMISPLIQIISG